MLTPLPLYMPENRPPYLLTSLPLYMLRSQTTELDYCAARQSICAEAEENLWTQSKNFARPQVRTFALDIGRLSPAHLSCQPLHDLQNKK